MNEPASASFNLVDQPWIPCLNAENGVVSLSLRDLFRQAHHLIDLSADSPMENAALYRFLLAILHRNFGPVSTRQWKTLWEAETLPADPLDHYLDQHHHRFDLFSPRQPFGQFSEDARVQPKSIISLKHGFGMLPSDWFDHQVVNADQWQLSPAAAARGLLTVLAFGFGGLSGIPRYSHNDALCAKGVTFLVQGGTVRETLLLNLNSYDPDELRDYPDLPFWELADPLRELNGGPFGLVSHYTFPARNITLYPENSGEGEPTVPRYRLGPGLSAKDVLDPMKHYTESKTSGLLPLGFDEERQLWRNSSSLFEPEKAGKQPPRIFTWLRTLSERGALPRDLRFQCKALGIVKNQGRADFSRQEQFPLPLILLTDPARREQLDGALTVAENASRMVQRALARSGMTLHLDDPEVYNWARYGILHGAEKDLRSLATTQGGIEEWMRQTGAERHFWATLDVPFLDFMDRLASAENDTLTPVKQWWHAQVRHAAESAFRKMLQCTNHSPRAFKAFAQGNNRLQPWLYKNLPREKTA